MKGLTTRAALNAWAAVFNNAGSSYTAQEMKFSIKDFLRKCDQIRSFLRICSHLLKNSLMENFIFCAVLDLFKNYEIE